MMAKKTLAEMSPYEVTQHYTALNSTRIERASLDWQAALGTRRSRLIKAAERTLERAYAYAMPRKPWHLVAAKERQEKYGTAVAAGFLAANGWSLEAALHTLLNK